MICSVKHKRGFTLIELLIVIAIISILSVVGIVLFTGIQKEARDSKRRADIDAIAKAYEVKNSSGSYVALSDSDFSSGKKPQDLSKGEYFNWLPQDGSGFKACASLDANPNSVCNTPATNCYCKVSTQGSLNPSSPVNQGGSTNYTYGLGGSSSQSCDPNGTLLSGLVGYWDFNGGVLDRSGKGNNGTLNGGLTYSSDVPNGNIQFGQSGNFDGVDDYVSMNLNPYPIFPTIHGPSSVSLWFKASALSGNRVLFSDNCTELGIVHNSSTLKGVAYTTIDGGTITTGGWHHAVITHDHPSGLTGTRASFYLDGIQKGSTITFDITTQNGYQDNPFAIGTDTNCHPPPAFFNGLIDDVRIYNRALSETEVNNLFNGSNGCIP